MAVGMDVLARRSTVWGKCVVAACLVSVVLMPHCTYGSVPLVLKTLHMSVVRARTLPFRDEMRYWAVPWKHTEHSAERLHAPH